jgi:Zn-dependent protease
MSARPAKTINGGDAQTPHRRKLMNQPLDMLLYTASTWIIPVLLAITMHEAAHGYAARHFGDHTAALQGRVTLNPLKHIDPFGTILLPGMLFLAHAPFMFGWAKPVPVNFRALRNPRRDMVWVAAAGPAINIALAIVFALLLHAGRQMSGTAGDWLWATLVNGIALNVMLAVFNMLPLPPLDGGRVAVGLLPDFLARPLAQLEQYGFLIIIGLLLILPMLGRQMGMDLDVISWILTRAARAIIAVILQLTGNV